MRVYVASPLETGDLMLNVHHALQIGHALLRMGHAPYVPHLSVFWNIVNPAPRAEWMRLDLTWVEVCEALIRLPGESPGADQEVAHAEACGIPVFDGVLSFTRWVKMTEVFLGS